MSTPRYLVAKYVPDIRRMEPRNIGIIVWSEDGVAAQFVAEYEGRPGEVDGRILPSYVNSVSAYKQWISYWRRALEKPELTPLAGGHSAARGTPGFFEALKSTARENYMLVDGGVVLDHVPATELSDLTAYLFSQLVEPPRIEEPRDPSLDKVCDELITEAHLQSDPHFFRGGYPIIHDVSELVQERYEFSHAYRNGSLRLYQRVPLSPQPLTLRKTVRDAAWMFQKVLEHKDIERREQGAALVYVTREHRRQKDIASALYELESATRILNVSEDTEAVRQEFLNLAGRNMSR